MNLDLLKSGLESKIAGIDVLGEGRAVALENQGVRYVNESNVPCSVNDRVPAVAFWVKNSAEALGDGFGKKFAQRVQVSYTLVVNGKEDYHAVILSVLNSLSPNYTYAGSDFDQKAIAANFFGLDQFNFQSHFFTIDLTAIGKIEPKTCEICVP